MTEFKWLKPKSQIINDLGINRFSDILIAETAARYMNPYVPMDTGMLSGNYETGADTISGFVIYNSPYAHYQYNGEGFNFSTEMHPLATDHWDKAMMIANGIQFINEVDKIRKAHAR